MRTTRRGWMAPVLVLLLIHLSLAIDGQRGAGAGAGPGAVGLTGGDYFYQDKTDWVDPGNMFSYNSQTKSNEDAKRAELEAAAACSPEELSQKCPQINCSQYEEALSLCREQVVLLKEAAETRSKCEGRPGVLFTRFAHKLSQKVDTLVAGAEGRFISESHLSLHLTLTRKELEAMDKLLKSGQKDDCNLAENVEQVLSTIIGDSFLVDEKTFIDKFAEYLPSISLVPMVFGGLCLGLLFMPRSVKAFICYVIVAGLIWEALRVYKAEVAKRQAESHHSLRCAFDQKSESAWYENIGYAFSRSLNFGVKHKDEECHQYYKNVFVDPMLEVNPVTVFSGLAAKFMFHPLSIAGEYLGLFVEQFMSHIPFVWVPIFVFAIVIVLIITCLVSARYTLRIPFMTFSPSESQPTRRQQLHSTSNIHITHSLVPEATSNTRRERVRLRALESTLRPRSRSLSHLNECRFN